MGKKLSRNFWASEFSSRPWTELNPQEKIMLENLAQEILQPARDQLGRMIVTSGIRDVKDYHRLIAKGYYPSETSDHFYGASLILRSAKKIKKYGKRYSYSVGAGDIVPVDVEPYEAFKFMINLYKKSKIQYGQLIYEKHNSKEWIHVSNPPTLIYSKKFVDKFLTRIPVLQSLDGGRTYRSV